jgi:hypothetical protein
MPTFTEVTREKEGNALFEYAWKVRWPLSATIAFYINDVTSV